jgi:ArsR family transcriptional regulator
VREERQGGWTWLALPPDPPPGLGDAWAGVLALLGQEEDRHGDDARLAVVLRERAERRDGFAPSPEAAEPGRSWTAWARALSHLVPPLSVADLGCGRGALGLEVARWARRVVGVDADPRNLRAAREAARRSGRANVAYRAGRLDRLPLEDGAFDLALLSQALHREEDPAAAVREAARVVAPGGRVMVLDLLPHGERWVEERLGHKWLGFPAGRVERWMRDAGLHHVRSETAARRRGNPFAVLVASGRKP